jgi:glycosyltransferase involved in cell wall biosynthesis
MPTDQNYSPLISIVIPVFNGQIHLRETIESVLNQDYKNFELIVVDDGSTDDTGEILDRYQDRALIIRQSNSGPGAARNKGIRRAAGELIAFLDADDLWPADNLSQHVSVIRSHPNFDLILGRVQCLRAINPEDSQSTINADDARNSYLNHQLSVPFYSYLFGAAVAKTHIFQTVGLIDEHHHLGEDVDWFLRVRESHIAVLQTEHIALHYRRHDASLTYINKENSMLRVLKESLDRRRLASDTDLTASRLPAATLSSALSLQP